MQQSQYSIETRKGNGQSAYSIVFYITEGRKEVVAMTSEYIDSTTMMMETEKIIEEHQISDQT
jgi:hypothetical protein